jgi:hypothetical protein
VIVCGLFVIVCGLFVIVCGAHAKGGGVKTVNGILTFPVLIIDSPVNSNDRYKQTIKHLQIVALAQKDHILSQKDHILSQKDHILSQK